MSKTAQKSSIHHHLVTQFCHREKMVELEGRERLPAGARSRQVQRLPFVIRDAQWVRFADRHFQLQREGLYRFWDLSCMHFKPGDDAPHRVEPTRQYTSVVLFKRDILALLGAIAQLQFFGSRHDGMDYGSQLQQIKSGSLSLTCGPAADFTRTLLEKLGWQVRNVGLTRLTGDLNNWGDGHILTEFYWPRYRKWVMCDVGIHIVFGSRGRYLSAGDVAERIRQGKDYDVEQLTAPGVGLVDTSEAVMGEFPQAGISEFGFHDIKRWKAGMRDFFLTPSLAQDGLAYFYSDNDQHALRIESRQSYFRRVSRSQWWRRFYGRRRPC